MSLFIELFTILLTLFPTWLAVTVMAFITFITIMIVIKIVAFVLDAVPFL